MSESIACRRMSGVEATVEGEAWDEVVREGRSERRKRPICCGRGPCGSVRLDRREMSKIKAETHSVLVGRDSLAPSEVAERAERADPDRLTRRRRLCRELRGVHLLDQERRSVGADDL